MSTAADEKRVAFPSEADFETALDRLKAAIEAVNAVRWKLWAISTFRGEHEPSFEQLGRVYAFKIDADFDLCELKSYIQALEPILRDLDYVRVCGNVNPDVVRADA